MENDSILEASNAELRKIMEDPLHKFRSDLGNYLILLEGYQQAIINDRNTDFYVIRINGAIEKIRLELSALNEKADPIRRNVKNILESMEEIVRSGGLNLGYFESINQDINKIDEILATRSVANKHAN